MTTFRYSDEGWGQFDDNGETWIDPNARNAAMNTIAAGGGNDWGRWGYDEDTYQTFWIPRPDPIVTKQAWNPSTHGNFAGGFMPARGLIQTVDERYPSDLGWSVDPNFDPYGYRTDPNQVPQISDFFNAWNQTHLDQYGQPYNRPWGKHGETELRDSFIRQYGDALREYNQIHGTAVQPDMAAVQQFAAAPSEWHAGDPSETGPSFIENVLRVALPVGLSLLGAPYLSAMLGGGMTGAAGAGAILGGTSSALTGGDAGRGALLGALGGAAGNYLGGAAPGGEAGWTSGYDLPMGDTAGLGSAVGSGIAAPVIPTPDWTSGYDLPMGDTAGLDLGVPNLEPVPEWTSGYDLPMGDTAGLDLGVPNLEPVPDWTSGYDLPMGDTAGLGGTPPAEDTSSLLRDAALVAGGAVAPGIVAGALAPEQGRTGYDYTFTPAAPDERWTQPLVNPGLNPGMIGPSIRPAYQPQSQVGSQYYWGQQPAFQNTGDLANYNQMPQVPAQPWGIPQGYWEGAQPSYAGIQPLNDQLLPVAP